MTSLIKVPFASSGDKTTVPDTDAGGSVNMTQGYGQAYSLDPATDPSAKRIEREKMNWLFNIITSAVNEIQVSGVTPFISSSDNGGSPYSYGNGAITSLGGVVYQSIEDGNTTTPPGSKWAVIKNDSNGLTRQNPFADIKSDGASAIATALSNLGLGSGAPAIGIPFFWPLSAMPNTVMTEWADMVFLKFNDATFSAATYPKLALVYPALKLPEMRGEFLRIWDDGRGIDSGRALLSAQGDAIRNITGTLGDNHAGTNVGASGALAWRTDGNRQNEATGTGTWTYGQLSFNASSQVPTASENRPRNISWNFIVRAK